MISFLLFWVSFFLLFFCYIGYGLLVLFINICKKIVTHKRVNRLSVYEPPVSIVIAAYNEGEVLLQKLKNTLAIDYPSDKLKIIFVTDGTTDGSQAIISEHAGVTLLHQAERQGKLAAITRAMKEVDTPFVIFSDANTMLNKECIRRILMHYRDPHTGGVAGEKKIISNVHGPAIGEAEGLYWKYESFMKKQDAGLYTVVGAAGELFSIRTALFNPPAADLVLDDFVISMKICMQGYRIEYEPGAFAAELPSASLQEEAKRKMRISAGAFQAIGQLKECLNIFKYPLLCFQYVSRRVLRWVVCPWMLIVLLITNIIIVTQQTVPVFYSGMLAAQVLFYLLAFTGWLLIRSGKHIGILTVPFYFLFMNYCLVKGLGRFLSGKQPVQWEKSIRKMD
jgi:cellulose synthase/poly-beta-1,6-N-acetylglucosamine synthase-like glycosyltransferase